MTYYKYFQKNIKLLYRVDNNNNTEVIALDNGVWINSERVFGDLTDKSLLNKFQISLVEEPELAILKSIYNF